jgi:hypothetical protein
VKKALYRQLEELSLEIDDFRLPARLLAGRAGENRRRAIEQLLPRGVDLVWVKLILRRQLGNRCFVL